MRYSLPILAAITALFLFSCDSKPPSDTKSKRTDSNAIEQTTTELKEIEPEYIRQIMAEAPKPGDSEGRRAALQHCQGCHVFVEPELLTKRVWRNFVFPRMGAFLGMHHAGYKSWVEAGNIEEEKRIIEAAGVYPNKALVPPADWDSLTAWYLRQAPDSFESVKSPINGVSDQFEVSDLDYKRLAPTTSSVKIDEEKKRLFIGDMIRHDLHILSSTGERIQTIQLESPPSDFVLKDGKLWLTQMGFLFPSDVPRGELVSFPEQPGSMKFKEKFDRHLLRLMRPTHINYYDFDGDGREDYFISEFGNQVGRIALYFKNKDAGFDRVILMKEPGAMTSQVHDFNRDGLMDIAIITGQNKEGVHIFYNQGKRKFKHSYAISLPPCYGSSYFELADFNGDGFMDIIATNGDNGDYFFLLKPYHGIRIYENNGKGGFEESWFFPMNGAFKAIAEDFDQDGDLDIAAISMFADYKDQIEQGFIYLENQGGEYNFEAKTIERVEDGRWLTMDAGDLDGDGDKDVVIGNFVQGPSKVDSALLESWIQKKTPILFLENKTR